MKEPTGLIFVLEYEHAIVYAGDSIVEAREKYMPKMGPIHVWCFGKWLGDINYDGDWLYKTRCHEPVFESLMQRYRDIIAIDDQANALDASNSIG